MPQYRASVPLLPGLSRVYLDRNRAGGDGLSVLEVAGWVYLEHFVSVSNIGNQFKIRVNIDCKPQSALQTTKRIEKR